MTRLDQLANNVDKLNSKPKGMRQKATLPPGTSLVSGCHGKVMGLPNSNDLIKKISHMCAQHLASPLTPDSLRATAKIIYHPSRRDENENADSQAALQTREAITLTPPLPST